MQPNSVYTLSAEINTEFVLFTNVAMQHAQEASTYIENLMRLMPAVQGITATWIMRHASYTVCVLWHATRFAAGNSSEGGGRGATAAAFDKGSDDVGFGLAAEDSKR